MEREQGRDYAWVVLYCRWTRRRFEAKHKIYSSLSFLRQDSDPSQSTPYQDRALCVKSARGRGGFSAALYEICRHWEARQRNGTKPSLIALERRIRGDNKTNDMRYIVTGWNTCALSLQGMAAAAPAALLLSRYRRLCMNCPFRVEATMKVGDGRGGSTDGRTAAPHLTMYLISTLVNGSFSNWTLRRRSRNVD